MGTFTTSVVGHPLASELGDRLRSYDPRLVVVLVALFVLGAVLSFIRKLILLGVLLAVAGALVLAYRAGALDGIRAQVGL